MRLPAMIIQCDKQFIKLNNHTVAKWRVGVLPKSININGLNNEDARMWLYPLANSLFSIVSNLNMLLYHDNYDHEVPYIVIT